MAGRRPKPTEIKRVEGNPGRRPLNDHEAKPDAAIPDCPDHLDAVARAEWGRIAPQLLDLGLLSRIDRSGLAAYCQSWSRWVDAETNLKKFGTVIKTPKGYPIQSPYLAIANASIDLMRKMLVEFGMTPASRSKVHTSHEKPQDPLEDFLRRKNSGHEAQ